MPECKTGHVLNQHLEDLKEQQALVERSIADLSALTILMERLYNAGAKRLPVQPQPMTPKRTRATGTPRTGTATKKAMHKTLG